MKIPSCCRQLLQRFRSENQSVLCKQWILPVRLAVLCSLLGHMLWWLFHPVVFYTPALAIIHGIVALCLLAECRRSERFYQALEDFERRQAALRG